jgi:hypothetical protein
MELDPGYIVREPLPFGPRVSYHGLFEQLAEPLVGALGGSDGPLASLQGTIASNSGAGLDGTFAATVGVAADVTANHAGAGNDQTAGALVDNGGGVDAQRGASLPYLPQPDAPIEGNFRELPAFGAGHPGNGGIEDPDTNPPRE